MYVMMSYAYRLEKENVRCRVNIAVIAVIQLFPVLPIP